MSEIVIDKARAIELLERAVKEKGEAYVDPNSGDSTFMSGCRYADRDDNGVIIPSCIVGHALFYAGVTGHELMDISDEVGGAGDLSMLSRDDDGDYEDNPVYGVVRIAPDAEDVFVAAQKVQDNGCTWGEALKAAKGVAVAAEG